MKVNCKLCLLLLPWMGVIVQADWRPTPYLKNSLDTNLDENAGKLVKVVQNRIHEESVHGLEATKRYSDEPSKGYLNRVPSDFSRDISRLRIPDETDIPRGLSSNEAESDEASDDSEENSADKSEENRADDEEREEEEEEEEEEDNSSNEEADSEENQSREKEEEDDRRPEYDEYDDSPHHIVYESKKEQKKPLKKKPNVVHYEVTEKIPDDTKPQRPRGPVYPLPPPCPGAPPPTFPPPPPPATKSPPPTHPPPPAPPKGFYVPLADVPPVNHIPFLDTYFPTSYAAQTHSIPDEPLYAPSRTHASSPQWTPVKPKVSGRFPRRASPQRVIIRYHRPAYVVRKIQPIGPASDAVIVRHLPPPRPKEVHIHHHHAPRKPEPVIHVHKNDEDDALEEAKFTAELAGQRLFSEAELEAATSGPFAEPPLNFNGKKRSSAAGKVVHIHEK